jgi:hypothetical protein
MCDTVVASNQLDDNVDVRPRKANGIVAPVNLCQIERARLVSLSRRDRYDFNASSGARGNFLSSKLKKLGNAATDRTEAGKTYAETGIHFAASSSAGSLDLKARNRFTLRAA